MNQNFFYSKSRSAKSVRKNCFWIEYKSNKYLVSYQTIVAEIDSTGRFHRFWDDYSVTTMNHINAFIDLWGYAYNIETGEKITGLNKKEWLNYPCENIDRNVYEAIEPYFPDIEWGYNWGNEFVKSISYSK